MVPLHLDRLGVREFGFGSDGNVSPCLLPHSGGSRRGAIWSDKADFDADGEFLGWGLEFEYLGVDMVAARSACWEEDNRSGCGLKPRDIDYLAEGECNVRNAPQKSLAALPIGLNVEAHRRMECEMRMQNLLTVFVPDFERGVTKAERNPILRLIRNPGDVDLALRRFAYDKATHEIL